MEIQTWSIDRPKDYPTGFELAEIDRLVSGTSSPEPALPDPVGEIITRAGDIWQIGSHRLLCGDCRNATTMDRVFGGAQVNMVFTSPPYASQRDYDASSGFQPVATGDYVAWFSDVSQLLARLLAPDGSYFLNIKEHAEDGERSLYVKDLVVAHCRQWGWRLVDEFCWRKTDNGVPGGWNNRFKNAWEPVFHFCRQQRIKFRPAAVSHESANAFVYSPDNPKSASGSGLLGCGQRLKDGGDLARPSNVLDLPTETGMGSHSAPFPRPLVEFFVNAFTDPGDIVFDPFMGSGTTIAAAETLKRRAMGVEISPAYCDIIVKRIEQLTGVTATRADGPQ